MSDTPGDQSDSAFEGTLFPVFVTADLPLTTINACLKKAADFTDEEGLFHTNALWLVPDADAPHPKEPTALPVRDFHSPFVGKSLEQICEIFNSKVSQQEDQRQQDEVHDEEDEDAVAAAGFVVFDEQTGRDGTCLLACDLEEGVQKVRCECEIASLTLLPVETSSEDLAEGWPVPEELNTVLRTETYKKLMAGEFDEGDEDEEDDDE